MEAYFVLVFQRYRQPPGGSVEIVVPDLGGRGEYFDRDTVYGDYDGWWVALVGGRFALERSAPIRIEVDSDGAGPRPDLITIPPAPEHRFVVAPGQ